MDQKQRTAHRSHVHPQYFTSHLKLEPADLTYGTSLYGSTRLFAALAKHFNRPTFSPHVPVEPQHMLTGPGCGSLLDQIFEHIAGPGEGVLVAAPYYNGFDADLATRIGVKCLPVYSNLGGDGTEAESFTGMGALRNFEETFQRYQAQGVTVRSLLVCNPHNPVGKCYDREALLAYGHFAEQHNLHLVFDEIYSLSTFPTSDNPKPTPFISALNIDWASEAGCHPSRVHILTSASKDFGINGFRVGVFLSQHNTELMAAMKVTTKLYMVSSPADALFSSLLADDDSVFHGFVAENQKRLSQAYEVMKAWCIRHSIPYTPGNAGHFLLVDLSRFMSAKEGLDVSAQETALWTRALAQRVCITPGSNYHHPTAGVFRITFSMPKDILTEGLARLETALDLTVPSSTQQSGTVDAASVATVMNDLELQDDSRSTTKLRHHHRPGRPMSPLRKATRRSQSPTVLKASKAQVSLPQVSTNGTILSRPSYSLVYSALCDGESLAAGPEHTTNLAPLADKASTPMDLETLNAVLRGKVVGCLC